MSPNVAIKAEIGRVKSKSPQMSSLLTLQVRLAVDEAHLRQLLQLRLVSFLWRLIRIRLVRHSVQHPLHEVAKDLLLSGGWRVSGLRGLRGAWWRWWNAHRTDESRRYLSQLFHALLDLEDRVDCLRRERERETSATESATTRRFHT
jgi:hypothetical protein